MARRSAPRFQEDDSLQRGRSYLPTGDAHVENGATVFVHTADSRKILSEALITPVASNGCARQSTEGQKSRLMRAMARCCRSNSKIRGKRQSRLARRDQPLPVSSYFERTSLGTGRGPLLNVFNTLP